MTKQASLYEELKELATGWSDANAVGLFVMGNLPAILSALKDQERYRDKSRWRNILTEVVVKQLHYLENVDKVNSLRTAKEVSDLLEGAMHRYFNDAIFHAKVQTMVHAIDAAQSQEDRHG